MFAILKLLLVDNTRTESTIRKRIIKNINLLVVDF